MVLVKSLLKRSCQPDLSLAVKAVKVTRPKSVAVDGTPDMLGDWRTWISSIKVLPHNHHTLDVPRSESMGLDYLPTLIVF